MQSEPNRCPTCQRMIFESGGHLATCPDRPMLAKSAQQASMFGGSMFEPLHRPLDNGMGLPPRPDDLGDKS